MKMVGDDCEPELHLSLGSSTESNRIGGSSANSEQNNQQQQQQQQQQQITIFYNGRICVCDVTEFQVRAIISMANREMDDRLKKKQLHHQQQHQYLQENRNESSPPHQPQAAPPQLLNQGLLMKRSLQRFLQKRKTRINAATTPYTPYNHRHEILFSPTS
ncbi:protein TIFY 5A [Elaeis guineensis]|uniref:Protein TIFY n=1 Tax=Elaeis guineensis var. tenera TaxID=51953 RepID=A0A6I9SKB8_ELAGV|nr:protein TIFY 5A [Elaeis guineensis]